jgi:hypothetical protein
MAQSRLVCESRSGLKASVQIDLNKEKRNKQAKTKREPVTMFDAQLRNKGRRGEDGVGAELRAALTFCGRSVVQGRGRERWSEGRKRVGCHPSLAQLQAQTPPPDYDASNKQANRQTGDIQRSAQEEEASLESGE